MFGAKIYTEDMMINPKQLTGLVREGFIEGAEPVCREIADQAADNCPKSRDNSHARYVARYRKKAEREEEKIASGKRDPSKRIYDIRTIEESYRSKDAVTVKMLDPHGVNVKIGTAVFYAKFHELGTRKLAARPALFPAFESLGDKLFVSIRRGISARLKRG